MCLGRGRLRGVHHLGPLARALMWPAVALEERARFAGLRPRGGGRLADGLIGDPPLELEDEI
eukprot:9977368-Lingulodinium_polyedra.AAC.1